MVEATVDNVVVFALRDGAEPLITRVPHSVDDGIRLAWQALGAQHDAHPGQVTEVHPTWGPTDADARFVALTFPGAKLTWMFDRPGPDGWPEAFAQAQRVIDDATERLRAEEAQERARGLLTSSSAGVLLPVLRSASLRGTGTILDAMPHYFLVPDRLFVTFARVAPTPHGTIGMSHLMYSQFPDVAELERQVAQAVREASDGLVAHGTENDRGTLVVLARNDGLPAESALCLDDFHEWISGITGWDTLLVGFTCPDQLLVAEEGSPNATWLRRQVAEPSHWVASPVLPSLLRVTADGMDLVLEATPPAS